MAPTSTTTGVERIAEAFARARSDGRRAALMPYMMGGFPSLDISREIAVAYARAGADIVELGIPFSDPLADGPVIHAAATDALRAGASVERVLELAGVIAANDVAVVVMCYSNPILARGHERFAGALVRAGASGLIVPDLPLEEASELRSVCDRHGLALVPLVAPTTPAERLAEIGATARGFLYAVAVTGTTGERGELDAGLVTRAAAHTSVPVALGFGIASVDQAVAAADAGADGVIIGSRLVRAAGESNDPVGAVSQLLSEYAAALRDSSG
ncbi:MAG TPA: tryptophan synthase subunit alpha [Solirubrobacteraceae bacterium]